MLSIFAYMQGNIRLKSVPWQWQTMLLIAAWMLPRLVWSQQPLTLKLPEFLCYHEQVLGIPRTYHPDPKPYRFLAAGHWYGAHENHRSITPAGSLLAALPAIRETNPTWIFALGDVVRDAEMAIQVTRYEETLLALGQSAIIVPGNHDLQKNGRPASGLGTVLQCFESFGDLFLILETERLLQGGGKEMLKNLEETSQRSRPGRNLFVFSHRLLWALCEPGFKEMDDWANEPLEGKVAADTLKMVYDAVVKLANGRPLYWFSGDIGASWSLNVFEGHSEDGKRHFYAAGLGDCADDAFWQVDVDSLGNVVPHVFWLAPNGGQDSVRYDLTYWRATMAKKMLAAQPGFLGHLKKEWKVLGLGAAIGGGFLLVLQWIWRRRKAK